MLRGVAGSRAQYLRGYATYLVGEKRKEEEKVESGGLLGQSDANNKVGGPFQLLDVGIAGTGVSMLWSNMLAADAYPHGLCSKRPSQIP